jgi:hypothetical protein
MIRKATFGIALLGLGLALVGCGSPEGQVISKFFMATKSKDNATLTGMTRVGLPEEDADVASWKVIQVGAERREPFNVQELAKKLQEAKEARDRKNEEYGVFRDENIDLLVTIDERLKKDPNATFRGKQAAVHETYQKFRSERRELESQLTQAEQRFQQALTLAGMSLMGVTDPKSLQSFSGDVLIKDVDVHLTGKDGKEKPYVFTLQRYALTDPKTNRVGQARWIITDIKPKEAAAASTGGAS